MKHWNLLVIICLIGFIGSLQAGEMDGSMTLNAEATIPIDNEEYRARISAAFNVSAESLKSGELQVDQFNLVIFGVPQSVITGRDAVGRETGTLGFSISGKQTRLHYDPLKQSIVGELLGSVNLPGYIDPKPTPIDRTKHNEGHLFVADTQDASIKLLINLEKDLQDLIGIDKQLSFEGDIQIDLSVGANDAIKVQSYEISHVSAPAIIDFGWYFEISRHLCVQPVRILKFSFTSWPPRIFAQYTGDGLPFGQPGAITQWNKADLTFHWNSWQNVLDPQLWAFDSSEATSLRSTVDEPDCVEVFFVDSFSPSVFWGGGATFESGTAGAQIISTDQNADYGVDFTHLAHELGHAVSLCHPGDVYCEARPEMNPASTGTLMCPSGFNNDNPTVNSVENKNSVNNPLTTFALKSLSAGSDCNGDADCGICP